MIRQLTVHDFEKWKELRLEAAKLSPASFGESFDNVCRQDNAWFADSLNKGTVFAYDKDSCLIGLIGTFPMQIGNLLHRAGLFGLYVKPAFR